MANLELITGHGESDHISSFDIRASNRATFGKGKYILTDDNNMATTISAVEKTLSISAGSCVWSGMHIRTEKTINIPFVSPASTDYVYFWLHYVRDTSTLVESVEIVSTTSNKVNADLIFDELPDDVTEAYTLFYSFTFNPNGNIPNNLKNEFVLIKGMNDFFEETTQKLNAQAAENAQQLQKLSADVNNLINGFEGRIPGIALDGFKNPVLLGFVDYSLNNGEKNVDLSESVSKFSLLQIKVFESTTRYNTVFVLPVNSSSVYQTFSFVDVSHTSYDLVCFSGHIRTYDDGNNHKARFTLNAKKYDREDITGLASGNGFGVSEYGATQKIEIYGIGRVAE